MQFTNKRIVKNAKNLIALNVYVYTLTKEDWIIVSELLQKSNSAVLQKNLHGFW